MWQSVEIASHIHKLRERLESCSCVKQNTYCINQFIYYKKWVNRPLNLILSESSQFFCANRPVRFFARIVPVESSQGGTGFCAKRPVTSVFRMSRLMRKPTICICETKGADQFAVTAKPIIVLVLSYTDSTISLFSKSKIYSFRSSSVPAQLGLHLCRSPCGVDLLPSHVQ